MLKYSFALLLVSCGGPEFGSPNILEVDDASASNDSSLDFDGVSKEDASTFPSDGPALVQDSSKPGDGSKPIQPMDSSVVDGKAPPIEDAGYTGPVCCYTSQGTCSSHTNITCGSWQCFTSEGTLTCSAENCPLGNPCVTSSCTGYVTNCISPED